MVRAALVGYGNDAGVRSVVIQIGTGVIGLKGVILGLVRQGSSILAVLFVYRNVVVTGYSELALGRDTGNSQLNRAAAGKGGRGCGDHNSRSCLCDGEISRCSYFIVVVCCSESCLYGIVACVGRQSIAVGGISSILNLVLIGHLADAVGITGRNGLASRFAINPARQADRSIAISLDDGHSYFVAGCVVILAIAYNDPVSATVGHIIQNKRAAVIFDLRIFISI